MRWVWTMYLLGKGTLIMRELSAEDMRKAVAMFFRKKKAATMKEVIRGTTLRRQDVWNTLRWLQRHEMIENRFRKWYASPGLYKTTICWTHGSRDLVKTKTGMFCTVCESIIE